MKEIVTDLIAEQKALDDFLCTLSDEQWELQTPADEGWTVKVSVVHIAAADEASVSIMRGDNTPLEEADKLGSSYVDTVLGPQRARAMKPPQVLAWWRNMREIMDDQLMRIDPKARIPWVAMPMGARAFATARLMETWAHGLDCYDAIGSKPVVTDRLRHIATLALLAMSYAYSVNNIEMPNVPIRIELTLPSGAAWSKGDEEATNIIRGTASDFCRVAVQRGHWKDTRLQIKGTEANRFIDIVQTYAGPPGPGRKPTGIR